jgi:hypothetical protein
MAITTTEDLLLAALLGLLMPAWLLAGFADWLCHRVQRIEGTSGTKESLLHLMMLAQAGVGLVAALLLDVDAGVIALVLACCVAHEVTTWIDLSYASAQRAIPPVEQWVHAVQLAIPWVGAAGLMLLHPDQTLALVGAGSEPARFAWQLKQQPLPVAYLAVFGLLAALVVVLPLMEELWRCRMAARRLAEPWPRR